MTFTFSPFNTNFNQKSYISQFIYLLLLLALCFLFTSIIVSALVLLIWKDINTLEINSYIKYIYFSQSLASIGMFLIPALLFSYLSTQHIFRYSLSNRFNSSHALFSIPLIALLILPIILFIAAWNDSLTFPYYLKNVEEWMRQISQKSNEILELLTSNKSLSTLFLNIFFLAVIPAICEEFLFRGTLQTLLQKWTHKTFLSICITSFIFSFIHFDFFGFIPRFLLSIYLGYLFHWGKSLWLPILAHFCHNAFSVILQNIVYSTGVNTEELTAADFTPLFPYVFICLIFFSIGIWWIRKKEITKNF